MYRSRNNIKYYVSLVVICLILLLAFYFSFQDFFNSAATKHSRQPAFFILLIVMATSIFIPIKNAAILVIEYTELKLKYLVKKITLTADQIRSIEILAMHPAGCFATNDTSFGIEIELKAGKKYFLSDEYIKSAGILKQELISFCTRNRSIELLLPAPSTYKRTINNSVEEKFSRPFLFSIHGVLSVGISVGMVCLIKFGINLPMSLVIVFMAFLLINFLVATAQSNYFIISSEQLIIRNQIFFWKKKTYDLSDLLLVTFERENRKGNFINIIFSDYSSKKYCAASLWSKDWDALKKRFDELGIPAANNL